MPVSRDEIFMLYFIANLFDEMAAGNNRYINTKKKKTVQHEPAVNKTSSFVSRGAP
jgi:hypothetical protein